MGDADGEGKTLVPRKPSASMTAEEGAQSVMGIGVSIIKALKLGAAFKKMMRAAFKDFPKQNVWRIKKHGSDL